MKYIKKFEYISPTKPSFNTGDVVICVNDETNNDVTKGDEYIVTKIFNDGEDYLCQITTMNGDVLLGDFYCFRFSTQLEAEVNKYNL